MARYLATVSYDGTRYYGFQKQPDQVTIQEEIERILSKILNSPVTIYGSGRTDAKVHAYGQTFHFDSNKELDLGKFRYSLNRLLPSDIHIEDIKQVDDDFHARFSALAKVYVYKINQGEDNPFDTNHIYHLGQKLDVDKMKSAARFLTGKQCFRNFTSKEEDKDEFIRMIHFIDFEEKDNILTITFAGNGFMRYMVRMLVGGLVAVGLGKESIAYFDENLYTEQRQITSYKAPAHGLYLKKVYYDEPLDNSYHTHTYRCGHARGEDEEYVEAAINTKLKVLGFSDHIFYPNFTGDNYPYVRGDYSLLDNYCSSILSLKEKYKNQIEIHLGFEAEYYEDYDWYYKELLETKKVEYLILGQHFIRENGITGSFLFNSQDTLGIKKYGYALIKGMETGYFSYVAHPDLYLSGYANFDKDAEFLAHLIAQKSLELNIPLELNLGGFRRGFKAYGTGECRYEYPNFDFWKIISQYGCKVLVGIDAHEPKNIIDSRYYLARMYIDHFKLNIMKDYRL